MNTGLLHLHNALRWVILISLLMSIYKLYSKKDALKTSKILLISSHSTLLLGLYQYFFGAVGIKMIQAAGMGVAMKDTTTRFWAVEHISTMLIAIVLITFGHISYKKTQNASKTTVFYVIALLLIVLAMPWPFREGIGRPWFPGMGM
jgi:cell division protein FtsW (lipid II flippase)